MTNQLAYCRKCGPNGWHETDDCCVAGIPDDAKGLLVRPGVFRRAVEWPKFDDIDPVSGDCFALVTAWSGAVIGELRAYVYREGDAVATEYTIEIGGKPLIDSPIRDRLVLLPDLDQADDLIMVAGELQQEWATSDEWQPPQPLVWLSEVRVA